MDALALLRLQIEWGADEALDDTPVDRFGTPAPMSDAEPVRPPAAIEPPPAGRPQPVAPATPPRRGPAAAAREAVAGANDLAALRAAISGFNGSSLRDTATHLVFAEGDPDAGLLVVGEVPDAEEDRAGYPFAGPSGLLLDRMLASIGLTRDRLLLTTLIPWRPPGDRKPSDLEIATCLPFIERLLAIVRPKRVLLMGSRPARLLLGGTGRPSPAWQRLRPEIVGTEDRIEAQAMRHPAYLLGNPLAKRDAWHQLLQLRKTLAEDQK